MKRIIYVLLLILFWTQVDAQQPTIPPIPQNISSSDLYELPEALTMDEVEAGRMNVRIHSQYRSDCNQSGVQLTDFQQLLNNIPGAQIEKAFPDAEAYLRKRNSRGEKYIDLSLNYRITFDENYSVIDAVNVIKDHPAVRYAEPHFIMQLFQTPNDPHVSSQYYLDQIKALDAFNINQGDSNVVIGFVDTGTSLTHPDLINKIKLNFNDPINGIDDDGDGYIDNYYGWDFGDMDNDPTFHSSDHGVLVCGPIAAETDNQDYIASVGNKCKYICAKGTVVGSTGVNRWDDGIIYLSERNIPIINMSWGIQSRSKYQEDIMNTAAINHDVLLISSAGNVHDQRVYYPASFKNVMSVAGTEAADTVWRGTTYNIYVDVCAPAYYIKTTAGHNGTYYATGTSLSAPIVCGAAGIVKSHFPNYSNFQVGQKLRVTADEMYTLNSDPKYKFKLGTGRINLYKALTVSSPAIRMDTMTYSDGNDEIIRVNDTLLIQASLTNHLDASSNLQVNISTLDTAFIEVLQDFSFEGVIPSMGTKNCNASFSIVIKNTTYYRKKVRIIFEYKDGNYKDFEFQDIIVHPSPIPVDINDLKTTITDNGNIGFTNLSNYRYGQGASYLGYGNSLQELGFMIGQSNSKISNSFRNGFNTSEMDFRGRTVPQVIKNGSKADLEIYMEYTDVDAGVDALGVAIKQSTYGYSAAGDRNYLIFDYKITNESGSTLNDLQCAWMADWVHGVYDQGGAYDAAHQMAYTYCNDPAIPQHMGIVLLSDPVLNNEILIPVFQFTDQYKWGKMSSVGSFTTFYGFDILQILSSKAFTLAAGQSKSIAFAMVAGESVAEIQKAAERAKHKYYCEILNKLEAPILGSLPDVCPGTAVTLTAPAGYESYTWSSGDTTMQSIISKAGNHTLTVTDEFGCAATSAYQLKNYIVTPPQLGDDIQLCGSESALVNASGNYLNYSWSNGMKSPHINIVTSGEYTVTVTDSNGCTSSDKINIVVDPEPQIDLGQDLQICQGNAYELNPGTLYPKYEWSTGSKLKAITVSSSGQYWLRVSNQYGCSASDTIDINVIASPTLNFTQAMQSCEAIELDAGNPGAIYIWSTGETTQKILAQKTDQYEVMVITPEGCTSIGTISINIKELYPDFIVEEQ